MENQNNPAAAGKGDPSSCFRTKIEDLSSRKKKGSQLQAQAAQQFRMQDLNKVMASKADAAAAGAPADEVGIEPRGIDLVMTQVSVSRAKVVKAHDGYIVSTIMKHTA